MGWSHPTLRFPSLIAAVLTYATSWCFAEPACVPIALGQTLFRQSLSPGSAVQYCILGLQPSSQYEIRVSFPGTTRWAVFEVKFQEEPPGTGRRLLDVYQVRFVTDRAAKIQVPSDMQSLEVPRFWLRLVHDDSAGSFSPLPERMQQPIVYNIVISRVLFGLPMEAFAVIIVGLLCVGAAAYAAPRLRLLLLRTVAEPYLE
eukprot:RCo048700